MVCTKDNENVYNLTKKFHFPWKAVSKLKTKDRTKEMIFLKFRKNYVILEKKLIHLKKRIQ